MSEPVCQERMLLPEALSGLLEPERERQVIAHLDSCGACQSAADDIEVSLVALALLRAERPGRDVRPGEVADLADARERRRPAAALWLAGVAAAILLVAGGVAVGHQLLPPRETVAYGPTLGLTPPAGASDAGARGTVAVAVDKGSLDVHLKASGLPDQAWFECLWVAGGQSRSAGSFLARSGAADVDLKVAPPPGASHAWDLQVVAHTPSGSRVVLEGTTAS